MRQRISTNIRWIRFLYLAIGLVWLYYIVNSLAKNSMGQGLMIFGIVSILVCAVLFYLHDNAKTVEFDKNVMYITGKTGEEKVPLKNVKQIKVTTIRIRRKSMWAIRYDNNIKTKKSVMVLPGKFHRQFDEFKYCVSMVNKDAKVDNRSPSDDFD